MLPAAEQLELDELELASEENQRLRQRVTDLELTVVEYRRQMTGVLKSTSWRVTSPLRVASARYRTGKMRTKRALKRWRERTQGTEGLRLAGLFPPHPDDLPPTSPLLRLPGSGHVARPPQPGRARTAACRLAADPRGRPRALPRAVGRHRRAPRAHPRAVRPAGHRDRRAPPSRSSRTIARRHRTARIEIVPNRGRDWAPLVHLANKGLLGDYDAVAKVHTKKSEHRIDGDSLAPRPARRGLRVARTRSGGSSTCSCEDRVGRHGAAHRARVRHRALGQRPRHRRGPRLPPADGLRPRGAAASRPARCSGAGPGCSQRLADLEPQRRATSSRRAGSTTAPPRTPSSASSA